MSHCCFQVLPWAVLTQCGIQILDADPTLHFALLRLQLIELIKTYYANSCNDPLPAIQFAQDNLAPRAPTNPAFLEGLEQAMILLFYLPSDSLKPELAEQLQPKLRHDIAGQVNEAIMTSHALRREARIKDLVRLRAWSELRAREAKKDIPLELPLGLLDGEANGRDDGMEGTDDEDDDIHGEDGGFEIRGNGEADLMVQ